MPEPESAHEGARLPGRTGERRYLDIAPQQPRRRRGLIAWSITFAAACVAAVWLMIQLSVPLVLAAATVAFMGGCMMAMGWWTLRRMERDDRGE